MRQIPTNAAKKVRMMRKRCTLALMLSMLAITTAHAMDFKTYNALTNDAIKELVTGKIADVDATLKRYETLMELGAEGVKERAKATPEDAKLMDLVLVSMPAMKQMKPEQLEEAWGDEGSAGDAIGRPLKTIDQFAQTRNYLDSVVHQARAYTFVKQWSTSHDPQALAEAKGELVEVLEHVRKIEAAK